MEHNKKSFSVSSSRKSLSPKVVVGDLVRDIGRFIIPRTTTLRGDVVGMRAFTLIELLVVVLIIGILAAVAIPQYQKAVMKTRFTQLKILTRSLADAQQLYYLANNNYATTFEDLAIQPPDGQLTSNGRTLHYDWGFCTLASDDSYVFCRNNTINMSYVIHLLHHKHYCVAYGSDINAQNYQICKAETNDTKQAEGAWYEYK